MDVVLFACVHNAGRSQMAAAWFNKLCDPTKARQSLPAPSPAIGPALNSPVQFPYCCDMNVQRHSVRASVPVELQPSAYFCYLEP